MGIRDLLEKSKAQKEAQTANAALQPPAEKLTSGAVQTPAKEIVQETAGANVENKAQPAPQGNGQGTLARLRQSAGAQKPPVSALDKLKGQQRVAEKRQDKPQNAQAAEVIPPEPRNDAIAPATIGNGLSPAPASHVSGLEETKAKYAIDLGELKKNLEYLAENIEQKELVGQVVRTIMVQLKEKPELHPFVLDQDIDLLVRGFRRAYAVAARAKNEKRTKSEARSALQGEFASAMKDAGIDFGIK